MTLGAFLNVLEAKFFLIFSKLSPLSKTFYRYSKVFKFLSYNVVLVAKLKYVQNTVIAVLKRLKLKTFSVGQPWWPTFSGKFKHSTMIGFFYIDMAYVTWFQRKIVWLAILTGTFILVLYRFCGQNIECEFYHKISILQLVYILYI